MGKMTRAYERGKKRNDSEMQEALQRSARKQRAESFKARARGGSVSSVEREAAL